MTILFLIHLMLFPIGLAFLFLVWPEDKRKRETMGLGLKPDAYTVFYLTLINNLGK